jgi:polyphosphate kinase
VLFLDDVIRVGAPALFSAYERVAVHAVKLSRDAELDIEEEVSGDLMEKIRSSLAKRATGFPARLLYDPEMPAEALRAVKQKTGIGDEELVEGSRYHNFRDFFGFPDFGEPAFTTRPARRWRTPPCRARAACWRPLAARPPAAPALQSFDYVTRLLREAATDPAVSAISITLYRVASKSQVVKALIKAARHGKQVTAVVELKPGSTRSPTCFGPISCSGPARRSSSRRPSCKCHAKLLLIARREADDTTRQYAYFSTGNFNESTSGLYTDHGLFTADERLTREAAAVLDYLRDQQTVPEFAHLLVAPFGLRPGLNSLIDYEIKQAKKGQEPTLSQAERPGRPRHDSQALRRQRSRRPGRAPRAGHRLPGAGPAGLQRAHQPAGPRGPLPGAQPGVRVRPRRRGTVFVSSADWMTRNLDRRVEVAFPILDEGLRAEVRHLLDLHRHDNVKARDFENHFICPRTGRKPLRAQEATYAWLKGLKRRQRK